MFACAVLAQEPRRESVVVTGTYEPVALDEVDRAITSLPVRDEMLVLNTLTDVLRLDASLDLRERAPNGVQSDLSIRGASFGQTVVLLNGQRLNDAQSGHHNMDIPAPLESVARVEVLRGSGSTLYGSDAVGGVINIVTHTPETPELRLRAAAGNFGVNQERASLAWAGRIFSQQLVFSRDFSTGFQPDRDYRNLALFSATRFRATDLTLAFDDRPFGADQFYGDYNSWERTKTWFAGLHSEIARGTSASLSYRRHTDFFVLYRDRPQIFTNRHDSESWQASLRRSTGLWGAARLHYGAEAFHESVASTNLGDHARSRGAAYAALDWRALHRASFTLGVREEVYRRFSAQFTPSASGGVWLNARVKLRAAASRAFRVPSYTDLYYHDPANLGSPGLRPERAWTYESGLDWNAGGRVRGDVTVFSRRERDGIDYVRRTPADLWRAANVQRLDFTGVEAGLHIAVPRGQQFDLRYTGLHGAQESLDGLLSKYVFNYPTHAAVAGWLAQAPGGFLLRTRLGVTDRRARDPYAIWDLYAARTRGRVHPFVQFSNITAAVYQEIPGVAMPGRSVVAGVELAFVKR